MTDPSFTHQVTGDVVTTTIDHEPDPENSKLARNKYLNDLAATLVDEINAEPSCFQLIKDGNGYNDHVVLTDGARVLIRRRLKENL